MKNKYFYKNGKYIGDAEVGKLMRFADGEVYVITQVIEYDTDTYIKANYIKKDGTTGIRYITFMVNNMLGTFKQRNK